MMTARPTQATLCALSTQHSFPTHTTIPGAFLRNGRQMLSGEGRPMSLEVMRCFSGLRLAKNHLGVLLTLQLLPLGFFPHPHLHPSGRAAARTTPRASAAAP